MTDALIIDACRTPRGIGKPGKGALAHLHPQHLGATVLAALAERNGLDTGDVDDIIWGTSAQVMEQGGDLGRMSALDAGYDVRASGVTLDRFCGSGITATNLAANSVMAGMEQLVVAGGTEMMSLPKKGLLPMGANNMHLQELHPQPHQGVCADAIATLDGIPREALDAHAAESQARADQAIKEGRFDKSLIPVLNLDGSVALDHEEFPRPQTTAESLAGLNASFAAAADFRHGDSLTFRELMNQKFLPTFVEGDNRQIFAEYLREWYDKMTVPHIQFNIVDDQLLREAQENPQGFADLQVRVAGYSAFWIDLSRETQDTIISRTEQSFC